MFIETEGSVIPVLFHSQIVYTDSRNPGKRLIVYGT